MLLFLSLFYLNFNTFLSHVFYLLLLTSYSFRLPLVTRYKLNYFWSSFRLTLVNIYRLNYYWSSFRLPLVTSYKLNYCLSSFRLPLVTSYKLNYCLYSFRLPLVTSYKLNYCWYSFRLPLATSYKLNFEDKILKRHGTGEIQFALRPEFRPFPFYYSIPYQYSRLKSCCFSLSLSSVDGTPQMITLYCVDTEYSMCNNRYIFPATHTLYSRSKFGNIFNSAHHTASLIHSRTWQ